MRRRLDLGSPGFRSRDHNGPIRVALESDAETTVEIGSQVQLTATGMPEDTESAVLCIGTGTTQLVRCAEGWKTAQAVSISLDLVTGNVRIRVRIEGSNYKRAVLPKLKLNLTGIAILQPGMGTVRTPNWQVPKNGRFESCLRGWLGSGL